jgi:hypothetical protein
VSFASSNARLLSNIDNKRAHPVQLADAPSPYLNFDFPAHGEHPAIATTAPRARVNSLYLIYLVSFTSHLQEAFFNQASHAFQVDTRNVHPWRACRCDDLCAFAGAATATDRLPGLALIFRVAVRQPRQATQARFPDF